jgi:hypothetical protein
MEEGPMSMGFKPSAQVVKDPELQLPNTRYEFLYMLT